MLIFLSDISSYNVLYKVLVDLIVVTTLLREHNLYPGLTSPNLTLEAAYPKQVGYSRIHQRHFPHIIKVKNEHK